MARLLVATVPLTGHVTPMLVLVRALTRRGHEVRWYGGKKFAQAIEAAGARFEPMRHAPDWDDADVEIAARVAWSGAGIDLRTGRPKPARVRAAVRRMLDEPAVRRRCAELSRIIAKHDGAAAGATLIEQLIVQRSAVRLAS